MSGRVATPTFGGSSAYAETMPYLTYDNGVGFLHLGVRDAPEGDNAIGPQHIADIHAALDELSEAEGPRGLVTTGAGKFFSSGLDTTWVLDHVDEVDAFTHSYQELLARILSAPFPTAAAVNGHAFGAGQLLINAHDHAVMRSDRGYLCMPGITIGASYAPGTTALVNSRMPTRVAHEMLTTGRRYGGVEAAERGIVDAAVDADEVVARATEYVRAHRATAGRTLGDIKSSLHVATIASLRAPVSGVADQAAFAGS